MIVQHPLLWCIVFLASGIAVGLYFPLPYYLPLLAALVILCTLLRKSCHWHDVLTLLVWFLLGCSRASIAPANEEPAWQSNIRQEAKQIQTTLVSRLQKAGLSPSTLALTSALTIGEKSGLQYETKEAYRKVGAAHLLALSGMHLGIIYGFLYLVFISWVRHNQWRWFSLPIILLSLWGYALIAGMPVSLVRAAIMLSIFTVISLMGYNTDPLHPLVLSAIIILLIAPSDLLSVSFQLSFSAVFFILALWGPIRDRFYKLPWAVRLLAVSFVATLGTMPLVCYYFHRLPLLSPLLSLVLIPATTLIIYLTLLVMAFPIAPFGRVLNGVEAFQQSVIDWAGNIPGSTLNDIHPSLASVVLIYLALLLAIIRLRTREL